LNKIFNSFKQINFKHRNHCSNVDTRFSLDLCVLFHGCEYFHQVNVYCQQRLLMSTTESEEHTFTFNCI